MSRPQWFLLAVGGWLTAVLAVPLPAAAVDPQPFELRDGDRVALVGDTLLERAQLHGHWEQVLLRRWPGRKIHVRNLGWSGDTVQGLARAGFGSPAEGYQQLLDNVKLVKPTVIVLAYGMTSSFGGEAGLPAFREGLEKLIVDLQPHGARILLVSPIHHEAAGLPRFDPAPHNAQLELYTHAIADVARERQLRFVDLFHPLQERAKTAPDQALTSNGIHLTGYGYAQTAPVLQQALGWSPAEWKLDIDAAAGKATASGLNYEQLETSADGARWRSRDHWLPLTSPASAKDPAPVFAESRTLRVTGLSPGTYTLKVDDQEVAAASAARWAQGVNLTTGPELAQAEQLRQLIIDKNSQFFHRWRPQNWTYLFGFRKHEQGQNAVEVPKFDELVADREAEIAKLLEPAPHKYQLTSDAR